MRRDDQLDDEPIDAEREADLLVRLVGENALRAPGTEDAADAAGRRFFAWWARELRLRQRASEVRAMDRRAAAFAERVRSRLTITDAGVFRIADTPVSHPPSAAGALRTVLGAAARVRRAPLVDLAVAAGVGRALWDEAPSVWIELPESAPGGEYIALTVAGDSMEPLLFAGDIILVRVGAAAAARGDVVVARLPDDGYVVKQLSSSSPAHLELSSMNPAYTPVRIPNESGLLLGVVVLVWQLRRGRGDGSA